VQDSQSLNLSLKERVRRKLILALLPKLSDLGQDAIGEAIEAAGAGQFGRLIRSLSMTAAFEMTLETLSLNRPYYLSAGVSEAVFLSLTAGTSTKQLSG
jgi:hypothetical protein